MRKILDSAISLCFILPYFEISWVREHFEYSNGAANFPASMLFLLLVGCIYFMAIPRKKQFFSKEIVILASVFYYMLLFRNVIAGMNSQYSFVVLLFQFLWFSIPFWYAVILSNYTWQRELDILKVVRRGLYLFAAYLLFCVVINIANYGFDFSLGSSNSQRIISTGGGPVILGYTIAMMLALILSVKPFEKKTTESIFAVLLTAGALFTGTRGGIWPAFVLLFVILITNKRKNINYALMLFFGLGIYAFNVFDYAAQLFPRVKLLSESGRYTSLLSGLEAFKQMDFSQVLFGTGLGNFFPYQKYCNFHVLGDNTFFYNDIVFFVQPHNTYIYLLLEVGLVGLLVYAWLIKKIISPPKHIRLETNGLRWNVVGMIFILMGFIESTVLIHPGVAGLWWLVLFITYLNGMDSHSSISEYR